jgi:hypothetical protein
MGCSLSYGRRDIGYTRSGVGMCSAPAAKTCALKIFFIIFVDGIFTTFIRLPFTNTSDAMAPMLALSCV